MSTIAEQTDIQEVDLDLNSWLNAPNSGSIVIPADSGSTVKPSFFQRGNDVSFVNNPADATPSNNEQKKDETTGGTSAAAGNNPADKPAAEGAPKPAEQQNPATLKELEDLLSPEAIAAAAEGGEGATGDKTPASAKKSADKTYLTNYLKERIEKGEMFAYDDWDESKQSLEEYLNAFPDKDLYDLLDTNVNAAKGESNETFKKGFFESLPNDFKYAYQMWANGAEDLQPVWAALSNVAQTRALDPAKETDRPEIVRQFLTATGFGTPEEVEAELEIYTNNALLEAKAKQFKPKLDAMSEQRVQQQVAQQEEFNKRQQQAALAYRDMAFKALQPGTLNDIKLDRKTQEALYNGLTRSQFPSIMGNNTNELGHLLEKYQFVEPNMGLIAEVLWHLKDPAGFRKELMTAGANAKVETQVRQLKTEQQRKGAGASQQQFEPENSSKTTRIPRPNPNFFKR